MKMMEDVILRHSIEIGTTPEKIFKFFHSLVDDASYRAWHTDDHVTMRWTKGSPWQEGSVVYAEEYIDGELQKLKFIVTRVVPDREIEYVPVSRFRRKYAPKYTFSVEPGDASCVFTAAVHVRVPLLLRLLARKRVERGLSSVRKHMQEEGENLKKILETEIILERPQGDIPNL
jgi:uncharacterized protein YndB with AHSA1/START domain